MPNDPNAQMRAIDQFLIKAASNIRDNDKGHVTSVLGYDYANALTDNPGYRASLYPTPGETYDQWASRVDKELPGFSSLIGKDNSPQGAWAGDQQGAQRKRVQQLLTGGAMKGFSPEEIQSLRSQAGFADPNDLGKAEQVGGPAGAQGPSGVDLMREYARHMMSPLDQNDPYVQSIISASSHAASRDAQNHGLHGGMATSNVAQGVTNALNSTQLQRGQLGIQAMQGAEGLNMQQAQMAQNQYNQQWQAMQGGLANQFSANKAQSQGMWGTIGGIGGGIVGGYFGGPAGAQAGMTAGSQLGAGLAGSNYGASPTVAYNPPGLGANRGNY